MNEENDKGEWNFIDYFLSTFGLDKIIHFMIEIDEDNLNYLKGLINSIN